jgi:aryl-alcohol dehydrogenase-like predicted oxidoreductase
VKPVQRPLIFGTGSLHRLATGRQRQWVIGAAHDAGISAFDLAPAYGNGIDEVEVGIAVRGRRDGITLNTKYGIPLPMYGAVSRHVFAARRLVDRLAGESARGYGRRDFSPTELERSLEGSLKRLKTDYVDGLFLHEPISALPPGQLDDIIASGDRMKAQGKIRRLGVAGSMSSLLMCPSFAGFDLVQTRCTDLDGVAARVRDTPLILYGLHAAYRATQEAGFPQFIKTLLARRPGTQIIVTSRHVERIRAFRGILE